MRSLTLISLFVFFIASSCHKDDSNYNHYSLDELLVAENEVTENAFSNPFHEQIIETNIAFFHLIITIARQSILVPEFYMLNSNYVHTRTGCPDFTFSPATLPLMYPNTVTMDFDDGGIDGNCQQGDGGGSTQNITYDGSITVIFNAALGSTHTSLPEIQVTGINSLMINDYTFTLDAGATVDLDFISGLGYNFELKNGNLTSTKGTTSTTLLNGASGSFTLGANGGVPDVLTDPSTYADNAFNVGLNNSDISCTNSTGTFNFCSNTSPGQSIELQPQDCACPKQGSLRIKSGACSTGLATSTNSTIFDFGYNSGGTDGGLCNDDAAEIEFIELISWEGSLTAADGEAGGETSLDIGVVQSSSNSSTESLQLTDIGSVSGSNAHGFKWTSPSTFSHDLINTNQTIANTTSTSLPWINEIHYANSGSGTNEGIEIAGPAGFDLTKYYIRLYSGNNVQLSSSLITLSGTIPDEVIAGSNSGYGAIWFSKPGLQDGPDDGAALVKRNNINLTFCD